MILIMGQCQKILKTKIAVNDLNMLQREVGLGLLNADLERAINDLISALNDLN